MTETVSTERLRMTRKALERAEKFAADYEFDSDEGFHVPSDLERVLMLDMLNGLFDDEEFIAALDATPPAPERKEDELRSLLDLALRELDALDAKTVPAQIRNALTALEPSPIHKGEADYADYDAGLLNDFGGGDVGWWQDYLRAEIDKANDFWREQVASPVPLSVTITPAPALLHGVCDSLRAAIAEYEDRDLYPGARKIMQAQIDAIRAALSKPGEQFECPINQPGCTKDCGSYGCGN